MSTRNSFLLLLLAASSACADTTLYVAPDGSDRNPGSQSAPLATLTGARNRVRQLRQDKSHQRVMVQFAAGSYFQAKAVTFDAQDSGTDAASVVYKAQPGAQVRLTGAKPVRGFRNVTNSKVLDQLTEAARPKVQVADLRESDITDFGQLSVHGFSLGSKPAESELFFDNVPMMLARWPNEGFRGVKAVDGPRRVVVDTDRVRRWTSETDGWVFAYWHHDWAELHERIEGVDPAANVLIRAANIKPVYGITPGRARWYAYNLLSELDAPGEYYLDREQGRLYFWPPASSGAAFLSQSESLIECNVTANITFQGFTIDGFRGNAIRIINGTNCAVVGCTIRNVGHRAVYVTGGTRHEVYGCDIYQCGEGGIAMSGGDRPTLTAGGHNAENNHVHHYSRRARTYKPGISVSGVGNRIAHNLIHHGPHMALSAGGNDHIVEFNEIHNVVYESGDAGAYYVGRDWTQRGNILRYNYWHQIVGATGHGGMTIYLDDQHCGHTIHGNLFERCSRAVFIGGGDDNLVTNNVFIDCWRAAHVDNRGMGWQKQATDDPNGTLRSRLRAMPVDSALWKQRYPTLPGILQDEPNIPKRNVFQRNISAGGSWDDIHAGTRVYQTVENNLVFDNDKNWIHLIKDAAGRPIRLEFRDQAKVQQIGFESLPLKRFGLYDDSRRASRNVQHDVEPIELPES